MKQILFTKGNIALIISLLAAGAGLVAALVVALQGGHQASMTLSPSFGEVAIGETISISVNVAADLPVNAFTGDVVFDSAVFRVQKIDYNTSIANLWVTEPWYNKSDNTVYFAGGTTERSGFLGEGTLLTIELVAERAGFVKIGLENIRILQHDGFGTDAVVADAIDSKFTSEVLITQKSLTLRTPQDTWVAVANEAPSTDLNGDGKQNFADLSIFLLHLGGSNPRYDFNQDGKVNLGDLSILTSQ